MRGRESQRDRERLFSQISYEELNSKDSELISRYQITNSHNVNPTEVAFPALSIAGPWFSYTLHRCSGEPNAGSIFDEKGRHSSSAVHQADDYRTDSALTLRYKDRRN